MVYTPLTVGVCLVFLHADENDKIVPKKRGGNMLNSTNENLLSAYQYFGQADVVADKGWFPTGAVKEMPPFLFIIETGNFCWNADLDLADSHQNMQARGEVLSKFQNALNEKFGDSRRAEIDHIFLLP